MSWSQQNLLDRTQAILGDLIAFPTISADSNLDLIAYAAERLEDCGGRVFVTHDATGKKGNLFASFGPEEPGGIVLSGHTDVVPVDIDDWTRNSFQMRLENGRLYGRGACDMKGFIAATLAMAPVHAARNLVRPLHVALTYDEEVGCLGARHLVEDLTARGFHPAVAIIGEPTEMRVIEGHKGCYEYTTRFHGTDGHGSEPDKGVNAIHYATRFVSKLLEISQTLQHGGGAPDQRYQPPWTTLQVGRIDGGSARNVIAKHCAVEWEMRPIQPSDAVRVKALLEDYCQTHLLPDMRSVCAAADIVTEVIGEVAGLEVMAQNEARDIICALTGDQLCDVVAFGTEAGLFQSLGMSVVVCGPGSIAQAHKPDEFVAIDQLAACLDMLGGLATTLERPA